MAASNDPTLDRKKAILTDVADLTDAQIDVLADELLDAWLGPEVP